MWTGEVIGVRRDKCIMFGVSLTLCWLGSALPGAVCRGAPEESGPAGVTLLNLIGETKLTNAVDSNPIHTTHTTR